MKANNRFNQARQILGWSALGLGILFLTVNWRTVPLFAIDKDEVPVLASPEIGQPQRLPITAELLVGQERIELEVASTPEQQQMGLMFRTELPNHRGMLFPFMPPRPVGFWMRNTLIPLDMVFVHQGKIQAIEVAVPPCKQDNCPTYGPNALIDQVIELPSGRAASLGLKVGDRVNVNFLSQPTPEPLNAPRPQPSL